MKTELKFDSYVKMFLETIPLARKVNDHTYVGRCIVCGDSKKDLKKTRLYLLKKRGRYTNIVTCHNCHFSRSADMFFEENFHDIYSQYYKTWSERDLEEISNDLNNIEDSIVIKEKSLDELLVSFDKELKLAKDNLSGFLKYTKSIYESPEALMFMRNRYIPEYFIKRMVVLKEEYSHRNDFRYFYFRDYILMTFFDLDDNRIYSFHARKYKNLDSPMPRFLACPYHPEDLDIEFYFNETNIEKDKPLIICEGTISSMNLPNSISTNGIGKQTDEFIRRIEHRFGGEKNIIYANDNEMIDHDAKKKSDYLISRGKRVFLWRLMANDFPSIAQLKDFNDVCKIAKKQSIPLNIIEKYTINSRLDGLRIINNV